MTTETRQEKAARMIVELRATYAEIALEYQDCQDHIEKGELANKLDAINRAIELYQSYL